MTKKGLAGERATTKGSRTRQRIIDAATRLFAERGYHATSLSDIGDAADIQRGALYYHIKAKEELLFQVLRQHVELVLENVKTIAEAPLDPRSKLHRLLVFQTEALLARKDDVTIHERESQHLTAHRLRNIRRLQREVEDVWFRVVDEARRAGLVRPMDRVVVKFMLGLIASSYHWFDPRERLSGEKVALILADFVLYGVVPSKTTHMGDKRTRHS